MFPSEGIIEEYFPLHYRTDYSFKKRMPVVKTDEKDWEDGDRDPEYKRKRQKDLEKVGYCFIRINLINQILIIMTNLVE